MSSIQAALLCEAAQGTAVQWTRKELVLSIWQTSLKPQVSASKFTIS
jgi:hypothetical protein